jgi:hypothetical protein
MEIKPDHFSRSDYFILWHGSHRIPSVESSAMVGNSFTNSCKDWMDGTYENFTMWAGKQFGLKEMESDDEADVPVHMTKAKDLVFQRNKKGLFVLPPMQDFKTVKQKQRVIRGYIGAVYRKFIQFIRFFFFFLI